MKKGTIRLLLISFFVLVLIIVVIKSYSSLSKANTEVNNKESDINVQLNRKTNQVNTIYINLSENVEDKIILNDIISSNMALINGINGSVKERAELNNSLNQKMNECLENVDKKILETESIKYLFNELYDGEKSLNTAMKNYNDAVDDYNSEVKSFPSSIIASLRGFKEKDRFEIKELKNIYEEGE